LIIDKKVLINITERNITYFKEKGYDTKLTEKLEVNITDLKRYSRIHINIKCDECKKESVISYNKYMDSFDRYGFYTCRKCSNIKKKITFNLNYNGNKLEELIERRNKTKKEKYENGNYDVEKTKETNLNKYGHTHHLQNNEILNKQKKTNLLKYGCESASNNKNIRNKIKKSNIETKYNQSIILYKNKYNINILDKINNNFLIKCDNCKNNYEIKPNLLQLRILYNTELCTKCNPIGFNNFSNPEKQLLNFIKEYYNDEIIVNTKRIIKPYELDIYLPKLKLAFEFNGLYWHSDFKKSNNYHKIKTDMCEEKGIILIHIYEDEWKNKQNIIKPLILSYINNIEINTIKEITNTDLILKFFNNYKYIKTHINIGSFINNEIVSILTINKFNNYYELVNYYSKSNNNYKNMLKYFIDNYKPNKIISIVDRTYYNGNIEKELNFKLVKITEPNYMIKSLNDNKKKYKIYNSGNLIFIYLNKYDS